MTCLCWHSGMEDLGRRKPAENLAWSIVEAIFHLAERVDIEAGKRYSLRKILAERPIRVLVRAAPPFVPRRRSCRAAGLGVS